MDTEVDGNISCHHHVRQELVVQKELWPGCGERPLLYLACEWAQLL